MEDFIRPDYQRRQSVHYCHRHDDSGQKQREVYEAVSWVPSKRLIDVGCGYGEKALELFPEHSITGIDFGPNISICRERHTDPGHCWKPANLECDDLTDVPIDEETVVVCADVIEHLKNLSPLLTFLRRASREAAAVAISTPERELLRGVEHVGPPTNEHHVREWSMLEFNKLLSAWNIEAMYGLCRSEESDARPFTILALTGRLYQEPSKPVL